MIKHVTYDTGVMVTSADITGYVSLDFLKLVYVLFVLFLYFVRMYLSDEKSTKAQNTEHKLSIFVD